MMNQTALLLIDIQNDFCPGGALPVTEGDDVVSVANAWMKDRRFDKIIASQDWHPKNHKSFATNHPGHKVGDVITVEGLEQILWPPHCIEETHGAEFHPDLHATKIDKVIRKGLNPLFDSYSAFFDNGHRQKTELDVYLQSCHIEEIYILGLATDYCVKYTALDARKLGYTVYLVEEGCRGVNIDPRDSDRAIMQMRAKDVILV